MTFRDHLPNQNVIIQYTSIYNHAKNQIGVNWAQIIIIIKKKTKYPSIKTLEFTSKIKATIAFEFNCYWRFILFWCVAYKREFFCFSTFLMCTIFEMCRRYGPFVWAERFFSKGKTLHQNHCLKIRAVAFVSFLILTLTVAFFLIKFAFEVNRFDIRHSIEHATFSILLEHVAHTHTSCRQ